MKKKEITLQKLIIIELLSVLIISFLILLFSLWLIIAHFDILFMIPISFFGLLLIFIVSLLGIGGESQLYDLFIKWSPKKIFELGTYEYFEKTIHGKLVITKIHLPFETIDLEKTSFSSEDLYLCLLTHIHDIKFDGYIRNNGEILCYVDNIKMPINKILNQLKFSKKSKYSISFETDVQYLQVKNSLYRQKPIHFFKIGTEISLLESLCELDLNKIMKNRFLQNKHALSELQGLPIFDCVEYYLYYYDVINQWKTLNIKNLKRKNFETNKTIFIH